METVRSTRRHPAQVFHQVGRSFFVCSLPEEARVFIGKPSFRFANLGSDLVRLTSYCTVSLSNTVVGIIQLPEKEAASSPLRLLSVTQQSAREEKGPRKDEKEARPFFF